MADKEDKFNHKPPHRPCGPWGPSYPYDKDYPGDRPIRPAPYSPFGPCWNDTERVITVRPGEKCCSADEGPCECVTSGDVEAWNETYSAVSANSAFWSNTSADNSWTNSADDWQSTYETVSSNSALWDSAYYIANSFDSGSLTSISSLISATSAFITTYSAQPYVHVNPQYLQGNGTSAHPIDTSEVFKRYWEDMNTAMNDLYGSGHWGYQEYRNWIDYSDLDRVNEHLKQLDDLMWNVKPNLTSAGRMPDGIFHQLERIWAILTPQSGSVDTYFPGDWISIEDQVISVSGMDPSAWYEARDTLEANSGFWNETRDTLAANSGFWNDTREFVSENSASWSSGSHETWEYAPDMTSESYSGYNEPGKIYFNYTV